jgi:hypothetical protein
MRCLIAAAALWATMVGGCDNCSPLANQAQQLISQTQTCKIDSDCATGDGSCGMPGQCGVALTKQNAATLSAIAIRWDDNGCGMNACHACPLARISICTNNVCVLGGPGP